MLKVTGSMSTKTGCAPTRHTQLAVAKKVKLGKMTSSPAPIPSAIMANSRASLPDAQLIALGTSHRRATSASSWRQSGPWRNRPESTTRAMALKISSRNGAFPPTTSNKGTGTGLLPVRCCDSLISRTLASLLRCRRRNVQLLILARLAPDRGVSIDPPANGSRAEATCLIPRVLATR